MQESAYKRDHESGRPLSFYEPQWRVCKVIEDDDESGVTNWMVLRGGFDIWDVNRTVMRITIPFFVSRSIELYYDLSLLYMKC